MSQPEDTVPFHQVLEAAPLKTALAVRRSLRAVEGLGVAARSMLHNLYEEAHLSAADWQLLVDRLSVCECDAAAAQRTIVDFCRNVRPGVARPVGPRAEPRTELFGRIISLDTFIDCLVEMRVYTDPGVARPAVRAMLGLEPGAMPAAVHLWPLGRYLIWSTFTPDGAENPFPRPLPAGTMLCCHLGLPGPVLGSPMLLLEYRLPAGVTSHVPTFVEAYSGSSWNPYFRTSCRGSRFGSTRPTGEFESRGRPEVLHCVIRAVNLSSPMQLV
jgi:hypothetical protein